MHMQFYISINFLTRFGKKPSLMQHILKIDPRHTRSKITRFRMKYFGGRNRMYLIWKNLAKSIRSCSRTKKFQKLDPKSKQFIFVGIGDGTKGYRYYNPKTHQTLTSRNVVFETQIKKTDKVEISHTVPIEGESGDNNRKVEMETENTQKQKQSLIPVPRENSARILAQPLLNYRVLNDPSARGPKEWQHHVPTTEENGHISVDYAMIGASLEDDPTSLKEAKTRSDWPKWKEAMDTEIDQLTKRGTYKMVDLPPDQKAIASKWVFRIERDHNGIMVKHKASLVAKRFGQIPGIGLVETFGRLMRLDGV